MEANKKRIFTEEHKRKLSLANKGHIPWSKGKRGLWVAWNKGEKIKLLCVQCGKPFEVLPYRKNRAKFCSKRCFFLSKKEKRTWHKEKIKRNCLQCKEDFYVLPSRIAYGKDKYCSFKCYWESMKGKPSWNKGKHLSEERKKEVIANCLKGRIKQANRKEPTSIEKAVYNYLTSKGILFERQKVVGNRFIVDAYIPSLNLVIEADGSYWHSTPRGIETDKRKNDYLNKNGYNLIRLSETEVKNGSFKERLVF